MKKKDAAETVNKPFLKLRTPALGLPDGSQNVVAFEILKAKLPQGLYSLQITFTEIDDENNAVDSIVVSVTDPNLDLDILPVPPPTATSKVKRFRVSGQANLFAQGAKSFNPVTSDATQITQFPATTPTTSLIHTKGDQLINVEYDGRVHKGLKLFAIVPNDNLLSLWSEFSKALGMGSALVEFGTARVPLELQLDGSWMVTAKALQDRIDAIVKATDNCTTAEFNSLTLRLGTVVVPIIGKVTLSRAAKPPANS